MNKIDPVTRAAILACKGQATREVIAERYGVSVNAVKHIWYYAERGECKPPPTIYTEELCEAVRAARVKGQTCAAIGAAMGLTIKQVEWASRKRGKNFTRISEIDGEWTKKQLEEMDRRFRTALLAAHPDLDNAPISTVCEETAIPAEVKETVAAQAQPVAVVIPPPPKPPVVVVADVVNVASRRYGFTKQQLIGKQREKDLVRARHIAMFAAIKITGRGLKIIGRAFHADHTTVLHARDKIKNLIQTDESLAQEIDSFIRELAA